MSRDILLVAKRGPLVTRDDRPWCPDPQCRGRVDMDFEQHTREGYYAEGRCDTCGGAYWESEREDDDDD